MSAANVPSDSSLRSTIAFSANNDDHERYVSFVSHSAEYGSLSIAIRLSAELSLVGVKVPRQIIHHEERASVEDCSMHVRAGYRRTPMTHFMMRHTASKKALSSFSQQPPISVVSRQDAQNHRPCSSNAAIHKGGVRSGVILNAPQLFVGTRAAAIIWSSPSDFPLLSSYTCRRRGVVICRVIVHGVPFAKCGSGADRLLMVWDQT